MDYSTFIDNEHKRLCAIRHDLHQHPELSFEEKRTTAVVKEELARLGAELIDIGMDTGAVARIRGAHGSGRTIAIRADIDCITQQECEENPVRSLTPGLMHACGHDVHTTCALGAAAALSAMRSELCCDVLMIFQPAEEVTKGAKVMLEHGLFAKPQTHADMLFGLHNYPSLPVGRVGVRRGALMACKSNFRLVLHGVAGHGGMPHKCVDVIVAASAIIDAVQTIVSRNCDPMQSCVCYISAVHGGREDYQITDELEMLGSVRALDEAEHDNMIARLRTLAGGIAEAYGCKMEIEIDRQVPLLFNGDEMYERAFKAADAVFGRENIIDPTPVLGSEDFAVLGRQVPSFFYWLGSGKADGSSAGWHNARFYALDETIAFGAKLLTASVVENQG